MECKKCGSNWSSNIQMKKCPFCGADLFIVNSDISIVDALKIIIQKDGKEILKSGARVQSMVMDYVKGYEREKKLFGIACRNGVLDFAYEMFNIENIEQQKAYAGKSKAKLEYDAFLSEENAEIIINIILESLGATFRLGQEQKEFYHIKETKETRVDSHISIAKTYVYKSNLWKDIKHIESIKENKNDINNVEIDKKEKETISIDPRQGLQEIKSNMIAVSCGRHHMVGLKRDGTVVAMGSNLYGQCNIDTWHEIVSISCGGWHTVGLKQNGTVVAVGRLYCLIQGRFLSSSLRKDGMAISM